METELPFDMLAQEQALQRRKAILAQQAQQAAAQTGIFTPYSPSNNEVGGFTLSTGQRMPGRIISNRLGNLMGVAAPLVAGARLAGDEARYAGDRTQFDAADDAAAKALLAQMPKAEPGPYGVPIEPPPEAKLQWAQRAARVPQLREIAAAYMSDQLIKEPEREEARAERKQAKADAIAEAQRKQEAELQYRRERDQQANDLRRDLHAAIAAHGGGGAPAERASDYQIVVGADGAVYRVGKKPGSPAERVDSASGKPSGTYEKDQLETRGQIERSEVAIREAPRVKELLDKASSSGVRADIRRAGSYVAPSLFAGEALKADEALKPLSDAYLKSVPRFEGPQSDADTTSYKEAAGQLANTNLPPPVRAAALDEVVRLHRKSIEQAKQRSTFSGNTAARKADNNPLSLRDSVKAANEQHGGGRDLTFNPATGKLE